MTAPATRPLPTIVLVLRPLGYLLVTAIYAVLLAAILVLGWGGLFLGIHPGLGQGVGAGDVVVLLLVVVVVGPLLGGALGIATALTASLTMLAGLALVRSLRREYAGTTLTHSAWSDRAVGPPRLTKGVLSLLPTRPGRFADRALALHLTAQGPGWRLLLVFGWLGVVDMVTAGWVRWPTDGTATVLWSVASVGLVAIGVVGIVRADGRGAAGAGRPPRRRTGAPRLP